MVALAVELEVDAAVDDALAVQPLADAGVAEQVDRALLEHAGADPLLDVLARAVLEHDRLDPLAREQLREREPGRARADDGDLRPQRAARTGTECVPLCTVIQRSSVNSSITAWPPNRP